MAPGLHHLPVHRTDVHGVATTAWLEVETGVGPNPEDLPVDPVFPRQHGLHDADGLDHCSQGPAGPFVVLPQRPQRPQGRSDPEPEPAPGGLVERPRLHRDQRRMSPERIDYTDTDPDRCGLPGQDRGRRGGGTAMATLRNPHLVEPELLRPPAKGDALLQRNLVGQGHTEPYWRFGSPDAGGSHRDRSASTRRRRSAAAAAASSTSSMR